SLAAAQPIPFDAARWTLVGHGATTMVYLERPSLFIENGVSLLRDSSFGDGTIEFDVALHGHASFAGVAFRALSGDDYELIYLRPHRSRRPDALQYTPIYNGGEAWQLYSGPGYTAEAELPLNRWMHVKLVVSGYAARLFVDGAVNPQLTVTSLNRPWTRGMIGLWSFLGGANFSNVIVSPAETTAPAARPAGPPPAPHTLTTWELSPAFETTAMKDDVLPDRAALNAFAWTSVTAENSGLVNISQYRRRGTTSASNMALVFARSVVTAWRAQQMKLVFAYSDRVHVFLNGRPLFAGDSVFQARDPGFLGVASLGPDAIYVDLRPGPNEIVLAVSEKFGGWGFAARLEPLEADATGETRGQATRVRTPRAASGERPAGSRPRRSAPSPRTAG